MHHRKGKKATIVLGYLKTGNSFILSPTVDTIVSMKKKLLFPQFTYYEHLAEKHFFVWRWSTVANRKQNFEQLIEQLVVYSIVRQRQTFYNLHISHIKLGHTIGDI